uniref:Uncharacterized protein n=1 Tax=Arundo donax TaxID=35708 RepID=A0A0A9AW66_ARUDO
MMDIELDLKTVLVLSNFTSDRITRSFYILLNYCHFYFLDELWFS